MSAIERYRAEFDRMPHYGAEGCVCGIAATPDRECPLHAANWVIERLEDDSRRAVALLREYGTHSPVCAWRRGQGEHPCDCGLAEALLRLGEQ